MVKVLLPCPNCDDRANVRLGQVGRRDGLSWFRSWNCESCGFNLEESGDESPREIREALIKEEGRWALIIEEASKGASAFKILKNVMGLSLQDIAKLRKDETGCAFTGTEAEVNFYKRQCSNLGLELLAINSSKQFT